MIILILTFLGWTRAQSVPPPPAPIVETDLRDNTIKMRSIELERVKRDAAKVQPPEVSREQQIRFEKTKENFEKLQRLQDKIILAYTTEKEINYSKIRKAASEMREKSLWLNENLFGATPDETDEIIKSEAAEKKGVRDLIIELDAALGEFVGSAMFQNNKVVDKETSKETQLDLENVIRLSGMLSIEAAKLK